MESLFMTIFTVAVVNVVVVVIFLMVHILENTSF